MTRTLGLLYLGLSAVGLTWICCVVALEGYRTLRRRIARMVKELR